MKKYIFSLIFLLLIHFQFSGQVNALFVNDNSTNEENTETIYQILKQYLEVLPYFNAVDSARSPVFSEMAEYNLVIWYCGDDEDDLYFWNGKHQDNPNLEEYLDNGGILWLMGNGYLNSRFIKPPREFKVGTFLNDYNGINKWVAESYTSDDGFGVPELVIANDTPVHTLTVDILTWENPPEPFVDGCDLVEGCYPMYIFGPNSYQLYGKKTAFYYSNSKFENITFAFDPAVMDSKGDIAYLLSDVLRFYEDVLSGVEEDLALEMSMKLYPNPATSKINIESTLPGMLQYKLIDILGNVVKKNSFAGNSIETIAIDDLPRGIYFIRIESLVAVVNKTVILTN